MIIEGITNCFAFSGVKLADGKGLGEAGRLTIARIDTIQSFYGLCIHQNKGDAKAMSNATKAILLHYSSTEEKPQHDCCPVGPKSWCSYQRDLACKTKTHRCIKDPIPPAVVEVIKPVFDKLGDEKFLGGCERCATQNANESLQHVIWGFAPKDKHTSQVESSLSVNLGVLIFNCGMEVTYSQLLPKIGVTVTNHMREAWSKIDRKRMYGGEYEERSEVKERRKRYNRIKSKKDDAFLHKEGLQYKSQAFYTSNKDKPAGNHKVTGKAKGNRKGKSKKTNKGK